jgi:hypothetical protein
MAIPTVGEYRHMEIMNHNIPSIRNSLEELVKIEKERVELDRAILAALQKKG